MAELANGTPEEWGGRPDAGDGPPRSGTNGDESGTNSGDPGASGGRQLLRAYLVIVALLALVTFIDVMTALDDARRRGQAMSAALPLTLEITSAIASVVASGAGYLALRLAPPSRQRPLRQVAIHIAGSLAYSAIHVGLMTALRTLAFAAGGYRYHWALTDLTYEYRKDILAYIVLTGVLWVLTRPDGVAAATAPSDAPPGPATFDIRDGHVVFRAPVAQILAARAAGNYVEFLLVDGRRPLMRAALRDIEGKLGPAGFLRTHRSWLVNEAQIRALKPAGSGDYRLELDGGVCAPLSRRYPAALAKARAGG
jgi:DNA-binding LytR/AlgR family response regulator